MNNVYYIYKVDSGEITCVYTGNEPELQPGVDESFILTPDSVADMREVYIMDDIIVEKDNFPIVILDQVITEVPTGSMANIRSKFVFDLSFSEVITDGIIDLSDSDPGTYLITLTLFPYIDKNFEVVVT